MLEFVECVVELSVLSMRSWCAHGVLIVCLDEVGCFLYVLAHIGGFSPTIL